METLFKQLISIVDQLLGEHVRLLDECEIQGQALRDGQTEKMNTSTRQMMDCVERIQQLEIHRQQTVQHIADAVNTETRHLNVTFLQGHMEPTSFEKLKGLSVQLSDVIVQIREANVQNSSLVEQATMLMQKRLELVSQHIRSAGGYKPPGAGRLNERNDVGHLLSLQG